jgi:uncharacterized Zn finger protein
MGARLDEQPELLFVVRGVDPADLITSASASQAIKQTVAATGKPAIAESDLSEVFGIDLDPATPQPKAPAPAKKQKRPARAAKKSARKSPGKSAKIAVKKRKTK